jgi:hypothetical protein
MASLQDRQSLAQRVRDVVGGVTITDIHTHLFWPSHGELLLWNVDELLTYHYLVAELFTVAPRDLTYEAFWSMSKRDQADLIWKTVFLEHGALSEAARGVITTLNRLGLDVAGRDLGSIRKWFDQQNVDDYIERVFSLAGLDYAVMTNNPFQGEEVLHWKEGKGGTQRFKAALRIDDLILKWPEAARGMTQQGYDTGEPGEASFAAARKFLVDWARKMDPLYLAASLPPDFQYPCDALYARIIDEVVLPVARELNLPMAMMIGVRKQVNPPLGDAGDAVGVADVLAVQNLCASHPDCKFLVTMLSRVNQHELCVCARKFGNLHLFGCWWFCNNPSIIQEMTRQRLELLGATVTAQHSDARVLDQLIYKWTHSRKIIGEVLVEKYVDLLEAGWVPTEEEVKREARSIFGGAFERFLAK